MIDKYMKISDKGKANIPKRLFVFTVQNQHLTKSLSYMRWNGRTVAGSNHYMIQFLVSNTLREVTENVMIKEETRDHVSIRDLDSPLRGRKVDQLLIILRQVIWNYYYFENLRQACPDLHIWEEKDERLAQTAGILETYNNTFMIATIRDLLVKIVKGKALEKEWGSRPLSFVLTKLLNNRRNGKYMMAALNIVGNPRETDISIREWEDRYFDKHKFG